MANTFSIQTSEIAAKFRGLFPDGFSATTDPTDDDVAGWIETADNLITLRYYAAAGVPITSDDRSLEAGRQYVRKWAEKEVYWNVYRNNSPVDVAAALKPYDDALKAILETIDMLGDQLAAAQSGAPTGQVRGYMNTTDTLISDSDLGAGSRPGYFGPF